MKSRTTINHKYLVFFLFAALLLLGFWFAIRYKSLSSPSGQSQYPNGIKSNNNLAVQNEVGTSTPMPTEIPQKSDRKTIVVSFDTVNNRGVKIHLCYGSDHLPRGEIIAYSLETNINYQANFQGSKTISDYYMKLPEGSYYFKYQAHASYKNPDVYLSQYYTWCNYEKPFPDYKDNCSYDLVMVKVPSYSKVVNICGMSEKKYPF